jgi:hypothetical protein
MDQSISEAHLVLVFYLWALQARRKSYNHTFLYLKLYKYLQKGPA